MRKKKEEEFKVEVTQTLEPHELKKTVYFGYNTRLLLNILICISFLGLGIFYLIESINFSKEESIRYKENSSLDYKVYLKENDFYDTPYLTKDMAYIASLIDTINIDFNYLFSIDTISNMDFSYGIYGKLIIADESGENTYFEKEYNLLNNKQVNMVESKSQEIKENISIDYGYYNRLANDFKMSYAIDTTSYLKVYLKIDKKNAEKETKFDLNDTDELAITIPLSEKAIQIKMDYMNLNETNQVLAQPEVAVEDMTVLVISIILFLVSIISFIKIIRLLSLLKVRSSNFDKYINKILSEYDRLVVETVSCPNLTDNNVIKIKKFEELLDVRDNLKLPIMYYLLVKHHKAYFYIKHNNDIFLLTVKAVDLEK